MVTMPSLRQIFSDKESLHGYGEGRLPSFDDVKRRLFLCERALDTRLPDHYYTRGRELSLNGIDSLAKLLTHGLHRLGDNHLELFGKRVYVQGDMLPAWQELLTFCPPLPLICGLLWKKKFRPGVRNPSELADFMREFLEPNTRHTCLPSPRFPQMENLLRESGLSDLHMHLSGATETDVCWQAYLRNPFDFFVEIAKKEQDPKVREQLEQEVPGFTSSFLFYEWLSTAQLLRRGFVHLLFDGAFTPEFAEVTSEISTSALLHRRNIVGQLIPLSLSHPLRPVFRTSPDGDSNWTDVTLEGLLYLLLLDRLDSSQDEQLANCFHYYLLILGFINRFLVQQVHQNGFDQFQKITLNDFRNTPEKEYARRFFQLHGNDGRNLSFLEGRFAPKEKVLDTIRLLDKIKKGWGEFCKTARQERARKPELRLVCHFIKGKDTEKLEDNPVCAIRHRTLRIANLRKAHALVIARETYPGMKELITGADAANNELETPPEVYAPVFRYLRRKGFRHFTFHAGEDFHHLIGGLRAMYEAVVFLDLRQGDRIGHGTAAGIDPRLWLNHVGDRLVISRGEWLDDLIFAAFLIERSGSLTDLLPKILHEVDKLGHEIYRQNFSPYGYTKAWLARKFCPFHLLADDSDNAMKLPVWDQHEWRKARLARQEDSVRKLVRLYHQADCRKRYHEKIPVRTTRIFSDSNLKQLQDILLRDLHKHEIILEVLPTSNVRISFYKNLEEHHIWRWLGLRADDGFIDFPPVVIGTDDAGIFSTNIYNEYNQIYQQLISSKFQSHESASVKIRQLIENAKTYRFME